MKTENLEEAVRIEVARYLKLIMIERGWTIRALAAESGLSVATIVCYRRGTRDQAFGKLVVLADAMGVQPTELMGKFWLSKGTRN
jgi:transcriptional regulator with XRE-family HTH domain